MPHHQCFSRILAGVTISIKKSRYKELLLRCPHEKPLFIILGPGHYPIWWLKNVHARRTIYSANSPLALPTPALVNLWTPIALDSSRPVVLLIGRIAFA